MACSCVVCFLAGYILREFCKFIRVRRKKCRSKSVFDCNCSLCNTDYYSAAKALRWVSLKRAEMVGHRDAYLQTVHCLDDYMQMFVQKPSPCAFSYCTTRHASPLPRLALRAPNMHICAHMHICSATAHHQLSAISKQYACVALPCGRVRTTFQSAWLYFADKWRKWERNYLNLHACLIKHNNEPQNVYYVTFLLHCAQRTQMKMRNAVIT